MSACSFMLHKNKLVEVKSGNKLLPRTNAFTSLNPNNCARFIWVLLFCNERHEAEIMSIIYKLK